MDTGELNALYDQLLDITRELGLGWVAEQVTDEVQLGKILRADFRTLQAERHQNRLIEPDVRAWVPDKRGPKEDVLTIEPYSSEDRLLLLLDAVERAVVETAAMETHFFEYCGLASGDINSMQFYSEDAGTDTLSTDVAHAQVRFEASQRLKEQLDLIRREI